MNERTQHFYDHAGWSYDPTKETSEQGRRRNARMLAEAELWFMDSVAECDWDIDYDADRSGVEHSEPLWRCHVWHGDEHEYLGGIDLGECWDDDNAKAYKRVVRAELAAQLMWRVTTQTN